MTTGIVYDEKMCLHEKIGHPEQPDRIRHIFYAIQKENLLNKCQLLKSRKATSEEILSVHSDNHLSIMETIPDLNNIFLKKLQKRYNSIYLNKYSYTCALLSAGSVVELCEEVVNRKLLNGIAIVRPPGHPLNQMKRWVFVCLIM